MLCVYGAQLCGCSIEQNLCGARRTLVSNVAVTECSSIEGDPAHTRWPV